VRISARAVDIASKITPQQFWHQKGLHAFLQERADLVFQKLWVSMTEGHKGKLRYIFGTTARGPC
jgi:hypothetical protein